MSKITGLFIDVLNETATVREIENSLQGFYDLLGCDLIEIARRKIGVFSRKRVYTIICDEDGVYNQPKISAIDNLGQPMLVGNLFIVKDDEDLESGELASLTADDIRHIKRFILKQGTHQYPRPYPMLHQCEYE